MIKLGIAQLPTLTFKNRHLVEQSTNAGCMYCGKIYKIQEIKNYTDNQKTCICPHCNIDAVIGDNCGFEVTEKSLTDAHKYWYTKK
jgi:hypothetical protein